MTTLKSLLLGTALACLVGCGNEPTSPAPSLHLDTLIVNGKVYDGSGRPPQALAVGISADRIAFVGDHRSVKLQADRVIDASGLMVTPGFIDPHTHALGDLLSSERHLNTNYLTQAVTTVIVGNDGEGAYQVEHLAQRLTKNGIGSNVGFLVGHGAVRIDVMGRDNRKPTAQEQKAMEDRVDQAMREGALGLSSGLYYSPGNYADTDEVVALAKVAARYGGLYESHIRDESSYTVGFLPALEEAITIGAEAKIPVHLAHIKALGVDVWGQSEQAVTMIEQARGNGQQITADQYPWRASGTHLRNALVPLWMLADSFEKYQQRLRDPKLAAELNAAIAENIRRRGGPESLLLVTGNDPSFVNKTLAAIAAEQNITPVAAALMVLKTGKARVISFNMNATDIERFMRQDWVVTSSDGNDRHPRKYASFPKKFVAYVGEDKLMSVASFVHRSSGLTADIFGIDQRGYITPGYYADIAVIDPAQYAPQADYRHWDRLSTGVRFLLVNGVLAIDEGKTQAVFGGRPLLKKP